MEEKSPVNSLKKAKVISIEGFRQAIIRRAGFKRLGIKETSFKKPLSNKDWNRRVVSAIIDLRRSFGSIMKSYDIRVDDEILIKDQDQRIKTITINFSIPGRKIMFSSNIEIFSQNLINPKIQNNIVNSFVEIVQNHFLGEAFVWSEPLEIKEHPEKTLQEAFKGSIIIHIEEPVYKEDPFVNITPEKIEDDNDSDSPDMAS